MEVVLIRSLTRAARDGLELDVVDGDLVVRGAVPAELLEQRDAIRTLLLDEHCVACGAPMWIREHATAIPWCRPCANRRGHQLLRHEHPEHYPTQEVA